MPTDTNPLIEPTLDVIRSLLNDVTGPDYLLGRPVDLETSFDIDLELESLEVVALAEQLRCRYGHQVDFISWLASLDLDEILALTVGDIVTHVVASLLSPGSVTVDA